MTDTYKQATFNIRQAIENLEGYPEFEDIISDLLVIQIKLAKIIYGG